MSPPSPPAEEYNCQYWHKLLFRTCSVFFKIMSNVPFLFFLCVKVPVIKKQKYFFKSYCIDSVFLGYFNEILRFSIYLKVT